METDITPMLSELAAGDETAVNRLFPILYENFRALAHAYLAREKPGHLLQTTALVNEVYLKLVSQKHVRWRSRAHFFAVGAMAMRRVLIDHARAQLREKRGGGHIAVQLPDDVGSHLDSAESLVALDDALSRLAALDPRQAKIVELRYFVGLTVPEVAETLQLAPRTVEQDWTMAKAWLRRELS